MRDLTNGGIFALFFQHRSMEEESLDAEEIHEQDAYAAVFLNLILIVCILLTYYIKKNRVYFIPESAAAMLAGIVVGGAVRLIKGEVELYKFNPELFFFVLLPPIIFEAGYSLNKKLFFQNIGAITMFAMIGTIISTIVVGGCTFYAAKHGLIWGVSKKNPMESLLFGALISAVDPVATLSIMGSPELQCNSLLYSLVFGESVMNDAIAITLFKTFRKYYDPEAPDLATSDLPMAFLEFLYMTFMSIVVGVLLGLFTSFIFKQTSIKTFPKLETTLLLLFSYCCYSTAEALSLSGIMALFFNGICLSHYNAYNLSHASRHATEQIFETLATVTETMVFLYMGMGVFTDRYKYWNPRFALLALLFCLIGRALNIVPLSFLSNLCRKRQSTKIPPKMQFVLWFAGLRGAIAFALAENMPGQNRDNYASCTLMICITTTVLFGGCTEKILTKFGMKQTEDLDSSTSMDDGVEMVSMVISDPIAREELTNVYNGLKGLCLQFDHKYLQPAFGGPIGGVEELVEDNLGEYELSKVCDSTSNGSTNVTSSDEEGEHSTWR